IPNSIEWDLPQLGLIRHSLDCQRCRPHGRYLERFEQRQIARRISGRRSQSAVDRAAALKCGALLAWVRVGRRSANGASRPFPCFPAKVPSPNDQQTLRVAARTPKLAEASGPLGKL